MAISPTRSGSSAHHTITSASTSPASRGDRDKGRLLTGTVVEPDIRWLATIARSSASRTNPLVFGPAPRGPARSGAVPDPDSVSQAQRRVGTVLRGKYHLDRVLGVGGMAVVYAATHRNTKRFAVKMLHPELSIHEDVRTRFLREGYVANSVQHPGAVAVLDDDVAEDGAAFLVMELLDGAPVDAVWEKHGKRVPVAVVVAIGDALLDVLAAAHAKGVVHRDIKPANLFLTSDGRLA